MLPALYGCWLAHWKAPSGVQMVPLVWVGSGTLVVVEVSNRDVGDRDGEEPRKSSQARL